MEPLWKHYEIKKILSRYLAAVLCLSLFAVGCSVGGQGKDVDLSTAIPLLAIPAPTPSQFRPGEEPGSPAVGVPDTVPINNLFNLQPGQFAPMASMIGVIDPVGTSLPQDFDGDGILNDNETLSNFWVADYPLVEASIATPVTLKIEILQSTTQSNDEIVSEITSDETENTSDKGSENIHRTQTNLRTVQFQDTFDNQRSSSISQGFGSSTSGNFNSSLSSGGNTEQQLGVAYGESSSRSSNVSSGLERANRESGTVTKWKDKPFKDNLDSDAWSVKSNDAAKNARKFRKERQTKIDSSSVVLPNAGYVRAALYIKNLSVNMPVRLSNILASLMFENGAGELIPVQSFYLRNDDYSAFEVDVYGNTEFGPYVIELSNLNTAEVENAIARGYSPKIFIVDYDMSHVPDSNYRSALLNYSGDNVKIVEENAKGRTALVKIFAPGLREMYRVAAFSTDGNPPDICTGDQGAQAAPGVSLRTALKRISCSGTDIEFDNFVIDLGDILPDLAEYKMFVPGVKKIAGFESTIPCTEETHTGSDGVSRTACVQKPYSQWTDAERENAGAWVVYSNGTHYAHAEYDMDGTSKRIFNSPAPGDLEIPMFMGIDNTAWVGDTYEITFLSYRDLIIRAYGTDPFETTDSVAIDTAWNSVEIGVDSFDPDVNAQFLGQAGFGEKIELRISLNETAYLDPHFGPGVLSGSETIYSNFSYNPRTVTKRFRLDEIADFEISLGFGGERSDWFHIVRDIDEFDTLKPSSCGTSLDYVKQQFYLCVVLPSDHPYVDPDVSLINVYLRPALNAAYRETAWPLPFDEVRRFRAITRNAYDIGDTDIEVDSAIGQILVGDQIHFADDTATYFVNSLSEAGGVYSITLNTGLGQSMARANTAYVRANVTTPNMEFVMDTDFFTAWNLEHSGAPNPANWRNKEKAPLLASDSYSCGTADFHAVKCLGFATSYIAGNWMGNKNYGVPLWNAWSDGSDFLALLEDGLLSATTTSGKAMSFQPHFADTLVNTVVAGDQTDTRVVVSGNRAFSVWRSGTELRSRFIDVETGEPLHSTDFLVNDVTAAGEYHLSTSENGTRGLVVWKVEITNHVHARVFDFTNSSLAGSEIVIVAGAVDRPGIAAWNNTAMVSFDDPVTKQVHARYIDLSAAAVDGASFQVSSFQGPNAWHSNALSSIDGADGKAVVVWHNRQDGGASTSTYRGRSYDLATKQALTAEYLVIDNRLAIAAAPPGVVMAGNRALYTYTQLVDHVPANLTYGAVFDIRFGSIVGDIFIIDDLHVATTYEIDMAANGNRAVAVYNNASGNSNLYATVLNLDNGTRVNAVALQLNVTAAGQRGSPSVAIKDDVAYVVYETNIGGDYEIVGTQVDLTTATISELNFAVNAADYGSQLNPQIALNPNTGDGYISWESNDNTSDYDIRGRVADIDQRFKIQFGLNNFFSAPLIRRQYEVQANIKLDP